MITWYLVRHGQTKWNVEGRLQGWLDSPLTEKGIEGAKQLGNIIDPKIFHQIYVSPSGRAYTTLEYAFGQEVALNSAKDERLREICLGDWQGLKRDEIMQKDGIRFQTFLSNSLDFIKEDSETYQDLFARVEAFVTDVETQYLAKKNNDEPINILVLTHGITLMMLEAKFSSVGIEAIRNLSVAPNATPIIYEKHANQYIKRETI